MSSEKKSSGSKDDGMWLVYIVAACAVLAFGLPVLAAALIFAVLRWLEAPKYLWWVSTAVSLAVLATSHETLLGQYKSWMRNLLHADYPRWEIPWTAVFTFGFIVAGVAGIFIENKFVQKVLDKLPWKKVSILENNPKVVPTDKELEKLAGADFSNLSAGGATSVDGEERSFVMGVNQKGEEVRISEKQIGMHMLAFGGTGSGKTVSLQVIAGGLLDLGWSGMILDLKEDTGAGGLRDWCEDYATHHAMRYQELALSNAHPDHWFNPLAGLGPDEARDTILSLSRFDDEYYKNVSIRVLGQLLKLMYWAYEVDPKTFPTPTMYQIADIMSKFQERKCEAECRKMITAVTNSLDGVSEGDFMALLKPDKVEATQAASWGAKIGNLFETQAGRTVLRSDAGRELLDVTQSGLTYIGLDSTSKLDLSKVISAAVLQRISVDAAQRTHGKITGKPKPKFIIIDEASIVDRTIVHALLSKARSAGVAVILATQGPKDWIDRDGDDFSKLSQNTNVALIMNQGEPESATICAEYIGKAEMVQANLRYQDGQAEDMGSLREMSDYLVKPDQLRQLEIGQAVVRIGKPKNTVSFVKVIPRSATEGGTRAASPEQAPTAASSPSGNPFGVADGIARPPR